MWKGPEGFLCIMARTRRNETHTPCGDVAVLHPLRASFFALPRFHHHRTVVLFKDGG